MADILPPDILRNVRLGISASASPDLARLGLIEEHFQVALGELARTVLGLGGTLQYCGHLDPNGYTTFLIGELKRYGRRDDPFSIVLAWPVHRRLRLSDLRRTENDLGLLGQISYLDPTGVLVDFAADRENEPPGLPRNQVGPSLTAMRQFAIRETQGRLFIGGRRSGYEGVMPGVLEEALMALAAAQPVFLAGGFGGVTHDIVRSVDVGAAAWMPNNKDQATDSGWQRGIDALTPAIAGRGWKALSNGLDEAENMRLAATNRPSEIAALVGLGLGRLARSRAFNYE